MSEPFASRFRPGTIEEYIGQKHILTSNKALYKLIESNNLPSIILWGPPGSGKTTLAYIISKKVNANFIKLSAVSTGKSELLKIIKQAIYALKQNSLLETQKTIVFLDEIHRWNKSQQDTLLPYIEKGIITLIGATTENPSFALNPALLSRTNVFTLKKHSIENTEEYLNYILNQLKKSENIIVSKNVLTKIAEVADGDLRVAANIFERAYYLKEGNKITKSVVENSLEKYLQYSKNGEDHFNMISAIHKCLRDSHATSACYYITRMLASGEDPLYIARRLLRFASEDIGNADTNALTLANNIFDACQKIGRPECDIFLIQLAKYLADAPKSNKAYVALKLAELDVEKYGSLEVPLVLRNAPTELLKNLEYGKGYKYAHDFKNEKFEQQHMPNELKDREYFD